jgi:PAP2 superfamily
LGENILRTDHKRENWFASPFLVLILFATPGCHTAPFLNKEPSAANDAGVGLLESYAPVYRARCQLGKSGCVGLLESDAPVYQSPMLWGQSPKAMPQSKDRSAQPDVLIRGQDPPVDISRTFEMPTIPENAIQNAVSLTTPAPAQPTAAPEELYPVASNSSGVGIQPVSFDLPTYQPTIENTIGQLNYDPSLPSITDTPLANTSQRLSLPKRIWNDHVHFYSPDSLALLAGGFSLGAIGANTGFDQSLQDYSQSDIGDSTKHFFHQSKDIGDQNWTVPIFASAWVAGRLYSGSEEMGPVGTWGERSMRGMIVGFPPLLGLQRLTGASRPDESSDGSQWNPFNDNNGVSGHSFVGAMPFITAAKMTQSRGQKALLYAGSTIVPISRVLDNAHYPSQIVLGWWVAYLAASAVDVTENPEHRWRILPFTSQDSTGILAEFKY